MKVRNDRTGVASRSRGTATKCSADPQSMPAAWGWSRSRACGDRRGAGGRRRWRFMGDSSTLGQPPGTGMRMSGTLLNGITSGKRRVTNDDAANPRTTLYNGLLRTSGGSASVPEVPHCSGTAAPGSFSRDES